MKLTLGKSVRLEKTPHCPVCDEKLDGATVVNDDHAIPEPGDLSVCFGCGSFLTYRDDMTMRLLTEMEVYGLDAHAKATLIEMRKRLQKYRTNGMKK